MSVGIHECSNKTHEHWYSYIELVHNYQIQVSAGNHYEAMTNSRYTGCGKSFICESFFAIQVYSNQTHEHWYSYIKLKSCIYIVPFNGLCPFKGTLHVTCNFPAQALSTVSFLYEGKPPPPISTPWGAYRPQGCL